jgi:predicted nucleotidyltransferase
MDLNLYISEVQDLCKDYGVKMLGVFGSVARGEDTLSSDIDLLVKFKQPGGMFEFIALEDKFVEIFGRKVDLGTEASLHPKIKQNDLSEMKVLYEEEKRLIISSRYFGVLHTH